MNKGKGRIGLVIALTGILGAGALVALAQDFKAFRGPNSRTGMTQASPSTPGGTPHNDFNNTGRAFLRWWNPVVSTSTVLDNDGSFVSAGGSPSGVTSEPVGAWNPITPTYRIFATGFEQRPGIVEPYRVVKAAAQTAGSDDPRSGATAVYRWTFSDLVPGQGYRVSLNIPLGPTLTTFTSVQPSDYPQRYYVADVQGDPDGAKVEVIDSFTYGGGWVRLGNNGQPTERLFVAPSSGTLTINLYNTIPRNSEGQFLDPDALPGVQWVYADAVRLESTQVSTGGYAAQPVVGELAGGTAPSDPVRRIRVNAARNEVLNSGRLERQITVPTISSYVYNGALAETTESSRLNVAWSWPAKRPINGSSDEQLRYARQREDFIYGPVAGNERHTFRSMQDNTFSQSAVAGSGFTVSSDPSLGNFIGPDAVAASAIASSVLANATGEVRWESNVPNGRYRVQVYIPPSATVSKATGAIYGLYRSDGTTLLDTFTVNQAVSSGWVTPTGQPSDGYEISDANPSLILRSFNLTSGAAGETVIADAVRWIAPANLSISSTPVAATVDVNDGSAVVNRDVVLAGTEDGRLYLIDGVGDASTGEPPQTYWTYPSPNPATDPNNDPLEDGGVAENPSGFGQTSGLIAEVGGDDLAYIASANGRVYALEVEGRGDGTTRRRWTWPNDYNPAAPAAPRTAPEDPILGSIAFGQANGQDAIFVPLQDGRIVALNAEGTAATKTTSVIWTWTPPSAAEATAITPVYAFGRLYANVADTAGVGKVYSINLTDGSTISTSATDFGSFGRASMLAVPGADLDGTGALNGLDVLYAADEDGRVEALNPADLTTYWSTTEVDGGAVNGLGFTYLTVNNNTGSYETQVPAVIVPSGQGSLVALYADGRTNREGERRIWQYNVDRAPVTAVATGGWRSTELRSWMYAADASGYLYAFNGNNDVSADPITPGDPPGSEQIVENDPEFQDLENLIDPNNFVLLSPDGYEQLSTGLLEDTLTEAQVQAIAASEDVSRRTFEYGETLYMLIHSLPDLGAGREYIIESILTTTGAGVRRQVPVRDVSSTVTAGATSKLWLVAIPILPNVNGSTPGIGTLKVRVALPGRGRGGGDVLLPYNDTVTLTGGNIRLANPLGVEFPRTDAATGVLSSRTGVVTDAYAPTAVENGTPGLDTGSAIGPRPETSTATLPGGFFGPDNTTTGDLVAHASSGSARMNVYDRTLSFLIFGPGRGLPNVRMASGDLAWQIRTPGGAIETNRNVYRPLSDNGVSYPGFEDLPGSPNRSLDYPDIQNGALTAARNRLSRVENPLFGVVSLTPPAANNTDITTYRTAAGFNAQMTRTLSATPFDLTLNVPRFQPASGPFGASLLNRPGYRGLGQIYVDVGDQTPGFSTADAHRVFGLAARIAPDERIRVGSPVIDLGSMPAGAGLNGGPTSAVPGARTVANPFASGSAFGPRNSEFNSQFTSYVLYNEGNVNLLDVRLARGVVAEGSVNRAFNPIRLSGVGMPQSLWLNSGSTLLTDLDPAFAPTAGIDSQARVFVQKPRPGDAVSTRLSTNPVRRPNANLGATGGSLVDSAAFPPGDPKVAAVIPVGTPTGQYRGTLYPVENSGTANDSSVYNPSGAVPLLGSRNGTPTTATNYEPYAEPGLTVTLNVREARLTSRPTPKGPVFIDANPTAQDGIQWDNAQPTGVRTPNGSLLVAWASNRLDAGNLPAFLPRARTTGDAAADRWRIYVAAVTGGSGTPSFAQTSPLELYSQLDLTFGQPVFRQFLVLPDAISSNPASLFSVPAGYTIDPNSVNFGSPVMDARAGASTAGSPTGWNIAFIGTATATDDSGNPRTISNIFVARLGSAGLEDVAPGRNVAVYGEDPFSAKTGLAIVQQGSAWLVTYTAQAANGSQLVAFTQGSGASAHSAPFRLSGAGFDRISAPAAHGRETRAGGSSSYAVDVAFSARRLGRPNSEVFIGRLGTNSGAGVLAIGARSQNFYSNRQDELVRGSDGVFWAPGVGWRTDSASLNSIQLVVRRNGVDTSILQAGSGSYDPDSGLLSYDSTLGGRVTMNTKTGLVQFRGAVFPSASRIVLTYSPTYVSVGAAKDANYRSVRTTFDQSLIPGYTVFASPIQPDRDEVGYLYTEGHVPVSANDSIRKDRMVLGLSRTSSDGGGAARGYLTTLRMGLRLPTGVLVNAQQGPNFGTILPADFSVNWTSGPGGSFSGPEIVPGGFRTYEVDPVTGQVYFQSEAEGRRVTVTYRGVDSSGRDLGLITVSGTVQLITELAEQPIPMEQPANESGFFLIGEAPGPVAAPTGYSRFYPPSRYWMVWTSSRSGNLDIFLQTVAPRLYARPPIP